MLVTKTKICNKLLVSIIYLKLNLIKLPFSECWVELGSCITSSYCRSSHEKLEPKQIKLFDLIQLFVCWPFHSCFLSISKLNCRITECWVWSFWYYCNKQHTFQRCEIVLWTRSRPENSYFCVCVCNNDYRPHHHTSRVNRWTVKCFG